MKVYYLLDWYDEQIPMHVARSLAKDIKERKSLVMISGDPFEKYEADVVQPELLWLHQSNIVFDEYTFINQKTPIDEMKEKLSGASVIFLLGGYTIDQNEFIKELKLDLVIKESKAVILGASAGAINMSLQWLCTPHNRYDVKESRIYDGIGLVEFSFQPHFDMNNHVFVNEDLLPFSEKMPIYAPMNEGAVCVRNGEIEIIGEVYLLDKGKIKKIVPTR